VLSKQHRWSLSPQALHTYWVVPLVVTLVQRVPGAAQ
jgi:hypothetical protein